MSGTEQMTLAGHWLSEDGLPHPGSVRQLWQWLSDPGQADMERVFFESCARSLRCKDGPEARFAQDSVTEWLPLMICLLAHRPRAGSRGRHAARHGEHETASSDQGQGVAEGSCGQTAAVLVLAVLHGLLLDLLATGDRARVQHAFDLFGTALDAIIEVSDL